MDQIMQTQTINVLGLDLPNKPLSNFELMEAAKSLKIPNFRGVFVRDQLPQKPRKNECGILNTGSSDTDGFHWICWQKRGDDVISFDTYGLPPPRELTKYMKGYNVWYNTERLQYGPTVFCGHACLYLLKMLGGCSGLKQTFQTIINNLW